MQPVILTPFLNVCFWCRTLLENSSPCTQNVGYIVVRRPITCCLLLLEPSALCMEHGIMWWSLEDTVVKVGKESCLFFYRFLLNSYAVQVPQAIKYFIGHLCWTLSEGEIWVILWPQGVVSILIVHFRVNRALIFQVLWKQPAHCYHCALLFRACGWITSW